MWRWRQKSQPRHRRKIPTAWIPAAVIDRTVAVLRQSGSPRRPHEGVAYWAGRRAGGEVFITTCIAPAASTTVGSFDTSSGANAEVVMYLARHGLELIGQVHSHPGSCVDHSGGDNRLALMPYEGFVSIIVPNYASGGMQPLTMCGIHMFEDSRFRRLENMEISSCFRIVDAFADLRHE